MKKYSIPITWESYQRFDVESENLQEAVQEALKQFLSIPDESYLEDSFQIDESIEYNYPDEKFDLDKITERL